MTINSRIIAIPANLREDGSTRVIRSAFSRLECLLADRRCRGALRGGIAIAGGGIGAIVLPHGEEQHDAETNDDEER
jgi:hypothetical protein